MGWFKPVDSEIKSLQRFLAQLEGEFNQLAKLAILQQEEITNLKHKQAECDEIIRSLLDTLDKITKCYEAIRDGRL